MSLRAVCVLVLVSFAPALVGAQQGVGPMPAPEPPPLATPRDVPYAPGTIQLHADITNVAQRIVQVQETIPVAAGPLVLLYPGWLPGNHALDGPIKDVGGLVITGNGQRIPWTRSDVNVYAFHLTVPEGVSTLAVHFQFLAPLLRSEGRISFDHNIIDLSWNSVLLYPAGYFSRDIPFSPSLTLPEGWQYATALTTTSHDGATVQFGTVPLNTLVDSPLYAGVNYHRYDLSPNAGDIVHLDIFSDTAAEGEMTPEELQWHRNLAAQALALFHAHHYKHYDFLLTLSNTIGGEGLEHHQSSEDGTTADYLTDWPAGVAQRDLLAHEYTHSWNGKYRRPYDLWTPNFNVPMQDDLLWVYEGLTQYWGEVLSARAGMRTPEQTRDLLANLAANFAISRGRDWRSVEGTTTQEMIAHRTPVTWPSWLRGEDYYTESVLIWLDADTTIRELSHGKKSLDDFAHLFYGMDNGSFVTKTYTFNQLVDALNQVQPYDWAKFFRTLVYRIHPAVPMEGITEGGYRLVYNDTEYPWAAASGLSRFGASFGTSLGFSVAANGAVAQVWWDSLAFKAGMAPGMRLLAVNGRGFSIAGLRQAVVAAEQSQAPIALVIEHADRLLNVNLDYHGGLRIPHLERVPSAPDRLDAILAPVQ
ncbi:MAG: M61 family metallopeptidase [Terriglobales bacterium]